MKPRSLNSVSHFLRCCLGWLEQAAGHGVQFFCQKSRMGMNQLPTHGQKLLDVPENVCQAQAWQIWHRTYRGRSWRSCWYSMALDASIYLSLPFGYTNRSACPCELELSRYAWTIAFEMSSLSAADPNGFSSVISSSSASMYWQFFFARHLSLENWIKSLTSTAIGFRSGVSVSLRVTLNT